MEKRFVAFLKLWYNFETQARGLRKLQFGEQNKILEGQDFCTSDQDVGITT